MRRGTPITMGGAYRPNKPPPGPLPLGGVGRVRLHSLDSTSLGKDRFGSPNLGSSLPISPTHPPINQEKTSSNISQDLHDCSMCLSAYIQSLNTVCGTACRLTQCLAQVGSDHDTSANQFNQLLKEAAEMWEGIARAVGVASTSVKNQIIQLIQELQNKCNMDFADQILKQDVAMVVRMMLSRFLTLHCHFSLIIIEKFSGMLQNLKDDNISPNNIFQENCTRTNLSPSVSPNRPTPSPPNMGTQSPYNMNTSPHHHLQQQLLQQQILLQQQLLASQNSPTVEGALPKEESHLNNSTLSSGCWSSGMGSPLSTQQHSLNSSPKMNASHGSANTLSPGLCSSFSGGTCTGAFDDWNADAISRRWSMGGSTEEGWQDKRNSITPFTLVANRRWSVPETTEYDPASGFLPLYGSCSNDPNFPIGGQSNPTWGAARNSLQPLSRENSCTRSPTNSRSVTPESKRTNSITAEELDCVINLLSLPLDSSSRKSSGCSSNSFESLSSKLPNCPQLDMNKFPLSQQRIPEVTLEMQLNRDISESDFLDASSKGGQARLEGTWASSRSNHQKYRATHPVVKDKDNQIITPLWPPTDNVPGVTLTECIGEEDKDIANCWLSSSECGNRDTINRSSWPNSSSRYRFLDDIGLVLPYGHWVPGEKGWSQLPSAFRRHSTDAPLFSSAAAGLKTRSFENISKDSDSQSGSVSPNIQKLICLSSFTSPEMSPENSQYSLFSPNI